MLQSHYEGDVDHKLKEVLRLQLARFADDDYFSSLRSKRAMADGLTEEVIESGCGDYDESSHFTDAEKCALRSVRRSGLSKMMTQRRSVFLARQRS